MIASDECTCPSCTREVCPWCFGTGLEWALIPTERSIASVALAECQTCGGIGYH